MRIQRINEVVATSEDGGTLKIRYANRGEPYREGCEVELTLNEGEYSDRAASVFLDRHELIRLRDALNKCLADAPVDTEAVRAAFLAEGFKHCHDESDAEFIKLVDAQLKDPKP